MSEMPTNEPSPRRRAAALFEQGLSRARVAELLHVSRTTSGVWYRLWREGGRDALEATRRPGPESKLSPAEWVDVQRVIADGPRAAGFDHDRWSLAAVALVIERRSGERYHPRHLGRVLRRLGWIVPPVGANARVSFRRVGAVDPDGNVLGVDERWRGP